MAERSPSDRGRRVYKERSNHIKKQGQKAFSSKGQEEMILGIARHVFTVPATPIDHYKVKTATGNLKK